MSSDSFSNKEMIDKLMDKMDKLDSRLVKTEVIIKKYNGLRETIGENSECINNVKNRLDNNKSFKEGRMDLLGLLKEWSGWLIAIISTVFMIVNSM